MQFFCSTIQIISTYKDFTLYQKYRLCKKKECGCLFLSTYVIILLNVALASYIYNLTFHDDFMEEKRTGA